VLATSYDSKQMVYEKYPKAEQNIDRLIAAGQSSTSSLKRKREEDNGNHPGSDNEGSDEWNGIEDEEEENKVAANENNTEEQSKKREKGFATSRLPVNSQGPKVLFSVDAKKLGAGVVGGGKDVRKGFFPRLSAYSRPQNRNNRRPLPTQESLAPIGRQKGGDSGVVKGGPWDIICFNFPHVGGLSTDVNRQVRSNQELLVSFFKACVPLLSVPDRSDDNESDNGGDFSDDYDSEEGSDPGGGKRKQKSPPRTEPGQILVTIFEGEPYTLWNVRDLARHAGLQVVRSFKFPWSSYPGYAHARTLGEIEARDGSGRGGWRGEEREARTFVFEVKGVDDGAGSSASKARGKGKGGKRGREDGNESSD
jgi:25S rRNA (uracil2634-N3)-methyltransferase